MYKIVLRGHHTLRSSCMSKPAMETSMKENTAVQSCHVEYSGLPALYMSSCIVYAFKLSANWQCAAFVLS